MRNKINIVFGKSVDALREYPMVLLMAFLGAVSLMCFAHGNYNAHPSYFVFLKFALVSCLGISLLFAIKMLSQRIGKGLILEIAGVLILILFYFLLPEKEQYFTEKYAFLIIPAFVLSHLLVSFIAFLNKKSEGSFWQYNKNLLINIFLTGVFTGVLTGGVELAILAVDNLFDFGFRERLYIETFYFLSIFGSCFIFLLFNENGLHHLEKEDAYPVILKFFTQYILIPLLIIYSIILYFYAAKILFKWELPRGWVSYLILAYSIVGIFALLLVHPLRKDISRSWVRLFSKIFYYSLAPLLILLFIAILTRITEYGFTEPRYFVMLLAIWVTCVVAYFIFARKTTIQFVPVSLFAFGLFSLIIPYLNVFSVSTRSQKTELVQLLEENDLKKNGKIDFTKKVTDTVAEELTSKYDFLAQREHSDFLLNLMSEKDEKALRKNLIRLDSRLRDDFRNRFTNVVKTKSPHDFQRLEIMGENKLQNISDYDYMLRFTDFHTNKVIKIGNDEFNIISETGIPKLQLTIVLNGKDKWDISPYIIKTVRQHTAKSGIYTVPELSTEYDLGNYHIKVVLSSITAENFGQQSIFFNGSHILIKRK